MNVIILAPCHVPFAIGGAEKLWWGLQDHLNQHSPHQADIVKLPTPEGDFWEVVASYRAFYNLDLSPYEVVVSGKYPAWMVAHPKHVCYMLHPLRGLYDTYPQDWPEECRTEDPDVASLLEIVRTAPAATDVLEECFDRLDALRRGAAGGEHAAPLADLFAFPGPLIRELVRFFDRVAFRPGAIARFAAISRTVAERPGYFPQGSEVRIAHPPSNLSGFHRAKRGRYLFTVSRLDAPKRIDLMIEAMRRVTGDVELVIAGTGPEESRLRELAASDPRVRFLGFVKDQELLEHYARAIAVIFTPYQEDFGLVAHEAMCAGKPVLTTSDSGGVAELVEHGVTGLVSEPDPGALAVEIEHVVQDSRYARRLGAHGRSRASAVSWERVCSELFDGLE